MKEPPLPWAPADAPLARVRAGDVTLSYRSWGQGRPLVLVHGGPSGSNSYWPLAVPYLGEERKVLAPDLRGHGASERKPPYSIRTFARDLSAFADALGLARPALLGHSFGALVALRAALDDPRFERVVLVGGFPRTWRVLADRRGIRAKARLGARLARWNASDAAGAAPPMGPHLRALLDEAAPLMRAPTTPEWVDEVLFASVTPPFDAVPPLQWDLIAWDVWRELPSLAARVLLVVGEHDALALPDARAMAQRIPHAKLALVPGSGHSPFFENPDAFRAAVEPFLREE